MQQIVKRAIEFIIVLVGLVVASPILLVVAILVKTKLGSPIIFRQQRVGLNGEIFEMVKFRTMKNEYDEQGNPLPDEVRLTKFGQLLRKTSLDELPELWNVLKGDMSLVGPRPLLVEYLPLYSDEQMKRHNVRPGVTGYAQVNGRNNISWAKKFELDVYYVENFSLWLDVKILFQTVAKVLGQADINQDGNVTIEKFNGMN
ncbi:sugar transferase [Turicibacter sanguinis]|uniref:Sugar transferase n=1 Tax=Turicibacter sanguinis TaxID=154288 RepID=A0A6I3NEZ0_9FIRM|nr:sugar transferase [Turicibacter sanguinis]KAB3583500.1 sugar transferase [Phocaeicola vulgatus]MTK70800.1 sugar transferase [Turicibacter sanguinis]MTK81921.1 sugar transferase [Turicibacter sanguinis]MTK84245.1 sugar transferase [Turicibacter sanguinis]MTK86691.1 sugar transferase [Turicibacter sanguinis]